MASPPTTLSTLPSGETGSRASGSLPSPGCGPRVPRAEGEPAFPFGSSSPRDPQFARGSAPGVSSCSVLWKTYPRRRQRTWTAGGQAQVHWGLRSKRHLFSFPGGEGRGDPAETDLRYQELDTKIRYNFTSTGELSRCRPLAARRARASARDHARYFGRAGRTRLPECVQPSSTGQEARAPSPVLPPSPPPGSLVPDTG